MDKLVGGRAPEMESKASGEIGHPENGSAVCLCHLAETTSNA